jgi:hypothetical protein
MPELESRPLVARDPGRRGIDKHIREIVIAAIALLVGVLGALNASAREQGATQEELKSVRAQLATTTESIRTETQNYANLLSVIQGQAVAIATLNVQVQTLLAQYARPK